MGDPDSLRDEALRLVLDMGYGPSSTIAERASDIRQRWEALPAELPWYLRQAREFRKLEGEAYAWVKLLATGERSPSDPLFLDLYGRMLELERGPDAERAKFEKFAIGRGLGVTIERDASGEYVDSTIYSMWVAWRYAIRPAPEPDAVTEETWRA